MIGTGAPCLYRPGSGLVSSFFIGGRYYFSDSMAAMLELGYGVAYLNLGVAFKF